MFLKIIILSEKLFRGALDFERTFDVGLISV